MTVGSPICAQRRQILYIALWVLCLLSLVSWTILFYFIPQRPSLSHSDITYEKYTICLCEKAALVK